MKKGRCRTEVRRVCQRPFLFIRCVQETAPSARFLHKMDLRDKKGASYG